MTVVKVEVASQVQQFPTGTVAGGIVVSLLNAGTNTNAVVPPVTLTVSPYEATFDAVLPGDYTASAQAVDSVGAALGVAILATFTVPAPVVTTVGIDVPTVLTVSF